MFVQANYGIGASKGWFVVELKFVRKTVDVQLISIEFVLNEPVTVDVLSTVDQFPLERSVGVQVALVISAGEKNNCSVLGRRMSDVICAVVLFVDHRVSVAFEHTEARLSFVIVRQEIERLGFHDFHVLVYHWDIKVHNQGVWFLEPTFLGGPID